MMMMAKLVSEWFMLVLSIAVMPADTKEIRVDVLQNAGRIEMVVIKRTNDGFVIQALQGDKAVDMATVKSVGDKPASFILKSGQDTEQTIDLSTDIVNFNLEDLRTASKLELKARDNTPISLRRSGNVVYLTPANAPVTYVCHP